jgi:hypothetical protein
MITIYQSFFLYFWLPSNEEIWQISMLKISKGGHKALAEIL